MPGAAQARFVFGGVLFIVFAAVLHLDLYSRPAVLYAQGAARERVLYVNAFDSSRQQIVPDLAADAFIVREDDVRREVIRVARATTPMPIAIVVDNSAAVEPAIADLRKGLNALLVGLQGVGPISIATVADRPTILADATSDPKALLDAAARLFHQPGSGATLLDGIADVAKGLARRESDRSAIVAVVTENVEFSNLQYPDVLRALRDSGAQLHVVVLVNPAGSFATDAARNRATVLDRGPRESGGVRMDVLTSMSFEPRLRDLAAIIKGQYRVVYSRPESLIPPEKIEVTSARPGVDMRGAPARGQDKK